MKRLSIICFIVFSSIICKTQVFVQDSIALVALYDSTNGDNWYNNLNWLDENLPVGNWYGIEIENYSVVQINLSSNNLVGNIPSEIGNLNSLSILDVSYNSILSIPVSIGNLFSLEEIDLSLNDVSFLPSSIGNCSNLKRLQLNVNNLQEIPAEIGDLTNLERLILGGNNINVLPDEIFDLTSLRYLNFAANGMDTIPSLIGNLVNLENFQFFNNHFTFIPAELGNCISLEYINGYGNDIDSLPLTLLNLPYIETLFLAYNSLTFDDIEPLVSIPGFEYWLQDSIGVSIDTTVFIDTTFYMEIHTGGEFNNYQWKKDNVIIEGATNNYLELSNITLADSGKYNCEITNDVAAGLTLHSRLINLHVEVYTQIDKSIYNPNSISLNVFPNPAFDRISLKIDNGFPLNEYEILLFNQYGKMIKKFSLETLNRSGLNISNLNRGVYYIQVKDSGNRCLSKAEKLIKL
ncbi:MAG: hypothetical protein B6D64_00145 [Bacteroidetes bacterium 4484_276]|nr:MAG: hypothetical protein B6D64_00145 [Bacteroidetes bacterium 4484_276]